ncbi:armadillo-type protein [Mycena latifolia]|nr:armadillo-type protein [Mycena latifolia]
MELIKAAILECRLTDSVAKFGTRTLLDGLGTGSTELRRRYARLFPELAADSTFRRQFGSSATGREIGALIKSEDYVSRQYMILAFKTHFVDDDDGRNILARGLPSVLDGLKNANPDIIWDVAQFTISIACHDNLRKMIPAPEALRIMVLLAERSRDHGEFVEPFLEFAAYDDVRSTVTAAAVVQVLIALIGINRELDEGVVHTITTLSQDADFCAGMLAPDNMQKILSMLADPMWPVRESGLAIISTWAEHEIGRSAMSSTGTIETLIMMLRDPHSAVAQAGLETVLSLTQHVDGCMTIFKSVIQALISMLRHVEHRVRGPAHKIICTILQHDTFMINPEIVTPEITRQILSTLVDHRWDVRESGMEIVYNLAKHDGGREVLSAPETISTIMASLQDPNSNVRRLGLQSFSALSTHAAIHSILSAPGTMRNIIAALDDPSPAVQQAGRETILSIANHASSMPGMIHEIISIIWTPQEDLRESGLETVLALAKQDVGYAEVFKPDMIERIFSMLVRPEWEVRESARRIIRTLCEHDTFGAAIAKRESLSQIILMLGDPHWDVRCMVLEIIYTISHKAVVPAAILTPETIQAVFMGLQDPNYNVQQWGLKIVSALAKHTEVHATLSKPNSIQPIVTNLRDPHHDVRQAALDTVLSLCHHIEGFATIFKAEMLALLSGTEVGVRRFGPQLFLALSQYDELRPAMATPEKMEEFFSMLFDSKSETREWGLEIGVTLAKTARRCMEFSMPGTIHRIMSMLVDQQWFVQESGRRFVLALVEHADFHAAISTPEIMQNIITMLHNPQWYVRQSGVMILSALSRQPVAIHPLISTAETIQTIIDMLQDPMPDVRQSALDAFTFLVQNEEEVRITISRPGPVEAIMTKLGALDFTLRQFAFRSILPLIEHDTVAPALSTAETFQRIGTMLQNPNSGLQRTALDTVFSLAHNASIRGALLSHGVLQIIIRMIAAIWKTPEDVNLAVRCLCTLVEYDDIRDFLSTPDSVAAIVEMIDGGSGDGAIFHFMNILIGRQPNISLISTPLVRKTLQIVYAGPRVRNSYIKIIRMLPS